MMDEYTNTLSLVSYKNVPPSIFDETRADSIIKTPEVCLGQFASNLGGDIARNEKKYLKDWEGFKNDCGNYFGAIFAFNSPENVRMMKNNKEAKLYNLKPDGAMGDVGVKIFVPRSTTTVTKAMQNAVLLKGDAEIATIMEMNDLNRYTYKELNIPTMVPKSRVAFDNSLINYIAAAYEDYNSRISVYNIISNLNMSVASKCPRFSKLNEFDASICVASIYYQVYATKLSARAKTQEIADSQAKKVIKQASNSYSESLAKVIFDGMIETAGGATVSYDDFIKLGTNVTSKKILARSNAEYFKTPERITLGNVQNIDLTAPTTAEWSAGAPGLTQVGGKKGSGGS